MAQFSVADELESAQVRTIFMTLFLGGFTKDLKEPGKSESEGQALTAIQAIS